MTAMASPTPTEWVVLVTVPDIDTGRQLARTVLEQRLAACVQLVPGLESHYWWEDKLTQGQEVLLILKSTSAQWTTLRNTIQERHPFEVPQIVALPIEAGLQSYLDWIRTEVAHRDQKPQEPGDAPNKQ